MNYKQQLSDIEQYIDELEETNSAQEKEIIDLEAKNILLQEKIDELEFKKISFDN